MGLWTRIAIPPLIAGTVTAALAAPAITVAQTARAVQPGELVVLTITTSRTTTPISVRAFDRDWPAFEDDPHTWRVLIGIDLGTTAGEHPVTITSGTDRLTHMLTVRRHAFPTRRLTVDPDLVNPPPEARERIQQETRHLSEIWGSSSHERLWSGAFVEPVPDPANSAFGTLSIYNGQPRSPHSGADFLSPSGRPVKAPNAGRVLLAESLYFTGNTVIIDHGLGLFSLFAHLSEIDVKTGDRVTTGDVVGKVGATGRVTGPHLHWTVRANGARVDPLSVLYVLGPAR
jgi:peptidase M23-like protein